MNELEKSKFFIKDAFLNPLEVDEVLKDFSTHQNSFKQAGIGKGARTTLDVRSDSILWLDGQSENPTQKMIFEKIKAVQDELNRNFFLGLWSFEGHYAFYPPGAFYQKHVDQFKKDDSRVLSFILYLNKNWKASDGGELLLYLDPSNPEKIEPLAGRLVCFWSQDLAHEVLPTKKDRLSFTGWFKKREITG